MKGRDFQHLSDNERVAGYKPYRRTPSQSTNIVIVISSTFDVYPLETPPRGKVESGRSKAKIPLFPTFRDGHAEKPSSSQWERCLSLFDFRITLLNDACL